MKVRRPIPMVVAMALIAGVAPFTFAPVAHAAGGVVINEIHYHAESDNPADEFIELLNSGGAAQDLSGWCIDGIGYCFPGGSVIQPGAFLVLRPGDYPGGLDNGGEHLRLRDAALNVVDEVDYDDHGTWPALADGDGGSLERRDPSLTGMDPGNWVASAEPSRGRANAAAGSGLVPVFRNVVHTVLPAPGANVDVTATLDHAGSATLFYRIGFDAEVAVPMAVAAGQASASIPGQAAGSLIRYRLSADQDGRTGTWPRQGDGAGYVGTTVAEPAASGLPTFEWFIDDATYNRAYRDVKLRGDNGFRCVLAFNGQVFDNTKVRVKGQVSRRFTKKKWKFTLPAGHELDAPGLLPEPVDEFALHGAATDKSFVREVISSELMVAAGVRGAQQIFPARLDRNNTFYGLYTYVEQPDGSWRDRYGYDDENAIIYEVGDRSPGVVMFAEDATASRKRFRARYGKETRKWEDDDALRNFIAKINRLKGDARRAWLYDNVDIAQVMNALAASSLIQHHDFGHKNYRLVLGASGRWELVPSDFDMSWGRTASMSQKQFLDAVDVRAGYPNAAGNKLAAVIWYDPVLGPMFHRRVRTMLDELLGPEPWESRMAQLQALIANDAALDRSKWGTFKEKQTAAVAGYEILTSFVPFRRVQIIAEKGFPSSQVALPPVTITGIDPAPGSGPEWLELDNPLGTPVDVSGWTIQPLGIVLPPGTVLPARQRVRLVSDITQDTHPALGGRYVPAALTVPLPDGGAVLDLRTANGDLAHRFTYGAPPSPAAHVVVNEINAVSDANLPGDGADPFWGAAPTGNGKDWVELAVVSDHTDLRGWKVRVADAGNPAVELVLPSVPSLADVRAGTIVTISEELADDFSFDPAGGDWWINVNLTGFDTSNSSTQVEIRNAADVSVFGPVGEGVNPASGVGSDETARLDVSPSLATTAASAYTDSKTSTFGQPNPITVGGTQDFSPLRTPVLIGLDTTAPSDVGGLGVTNVTGRTATATWNPASDDTAVAGYRVYVNGRLVGTPTGTQLDLVALPDATRARVEVLAVDASGNRSANAAGVNVVLPDATPPGPARGVSLKVARTGLKLRWTTAADLSKIAEYRVTVVGVGTQTTKGKSASFKGLAPNTVYQVELRAVDRRGVVGEPVVLFARTRGS